MNASCRGSRLAAAAALALLLSPAAVRGAEGGAMSPSIALESSILDNWDMKESGGLETQEIYKHYRMSSRRLLLQPGMTLLGRYSLHLSAGLADLLTHASEGETTQFAYTPAWGFGLRLPLLDLVDKGFAVVAWGDYLQFRPRDGWTVRVRHAAFNSGGTLSVDWQEWSAGLGVAKDIDRLRLSVGAVYTRADVTQDRIMGGGRDYVSTFKAKRDTGMVAAMRYRAGPNLAAEFSLSFINRTLFGLSCAWSF